MEYGRTVILSGVRIVYKVRKLVISFDHILTFICISEHTKWVKNLAKETHPSVSLP